MWGDLWGGLADLVLPVECAGCRTGRVPLRYGVCQRCVGLLERLRPYPTRPTPAPPGLPRCVALGEYGGVLRELLLAYKERGRHGLARPLGVLLAEVVAAAAGAPRPVVLVPVPATAAAVRARHGDHLARLTRHAAVRLRRVGWPVTVARPLWARPRADSATLDSAARAAAAVASFGLRRVRIDVLRRADPARSVIVVDDIVTTGATLAAVNHLLTRAGRPPEAAAVIAATRRRVLPR